MWFPTCGWGDRLGIRRILNLISIRIIPILLILIPRILWCIWRRGSAGGEHARLWQGAVGAGLLEFKEFVC